MSLECPLFERAPDTSAISLSLSKPPFIFYAYDTKLVKSSNPRASDEQLSQIEHTAPASSSILKGVALKMTLRTCAPPLRLRGPTPLSPPVPKLADFIIFPAPVYDDTFLCQGGPFGI